MNNFSEQLSGKVNKSPPPPPPPLYENLNPYQEIQDPHLLICLAGTHRWLNIDSTPYIESMLSQGYVPAWWSPVYTQKVNRKWDNRENIFAAYIRHKPRKGSFSISIVACSARTGRFT